MKKNPYKNKFATLLLSSVFVAVVALLASSCIVVVDDKYGAEVRYTWKSTYTWESSPNGYIESIAASYRDVDNWYRTVWYVYYPDVPLDASHRPEGDGSNQIPDNILSNRNRSTKYNGIYHPIRTGSYTAICTVYDKTYGDTYDIVANYEIEEYRFFTGEKTYYELAFDVATFLSGSTRPNSYFEFDVLDSRGDPPIFYKSAASDNPVVNVIEEDNVTYYVLRRPKV